MALRNQSWDAYVVETTYPGSEPERFSTYYAHAYTHRDDPGKEHDKLLIYSHPEWFAGRVEERQGGASPVSGESLWFHQADDALRCARLLEDYGRFTSGWDGPETWREKYRQPIRARVMHVSGRNIVTEVSTNLYDRVARTTGLPRDEVKRVLHAAGWAG